MNEYLTLIISTSLSLVSVVIAYFIYRRMEEKRYDEKENKAVLDDIRSSLESRIYDLNEKILINNERWRDVNHLIVDSSNQLGNLNKSEQIVRLNDFLYENGIVEKELGINPKQVFLLTPFNDQFYKTYIQIKEICNSLGLSCIRGDEHQFKSDIFPEMLRYIVQSKLIIANVDGRNPNVMYELGIAHALGKQVLLIARNPGELPIDIKSKRFIIYKSDNELNEMLRKELHNII